jgi:hypothetical protein
VSTNFVLIEISVGPHEKIGSPEDPKVPTDNFGVPTGPHTIDLASHTKSTSDSRGSAKLTRKPVGGGGPRRFRGIGSQGVRLLRRHR